MRILDATMLYSRESGGVRTYLSAKAHWIAQHTRIEHIIVAPVDGEESKVSRIVGVPGFTVPGTGGFRMPWSSRMAARTMLELEPNLIEAGDPYQFAWAALRVRDATGVPAVAFCHSDLPQLAWNRFGRVAERATSKYMADLYRRFDLVFAPSKVTAQRLQEMGVARVRCQPLGVDTGIFSPQRRDPQLRAHLGLPRRARLLVYAGRFTREKKLHLLLEAVQRLGDPYHVLMIGSGVELPNSPRVTYLPFQHDARNLAKLIASCDALVHPGDQETFGLIVLEAMACGIPVVGVAAGGVGELVDAETGVLVPPDSASDMAEGIRHIFDGDRETLGANARRKAIARHDWSAVIRQLMGHYARLFTARQRMRFELDQLYAAE